MNSAEPTSPKKLPWGRIIALGVVLLIGCATCILYACMQQYDKMRKDPYNGVPVTSFGELIKTAFDPSKRRTISSAMSKLSAYKNGKSYTPSELSSHESELYSAIDDLKRVYSDDNPYLVIAHQKLAEVLDEEKKYAQETAILTEALALSEKSYGAEHKSTLLLASQLGAAHVQLKNYAAARKLYDRALAGHSQYAGENSPAVAYVLECMGKSYSAENKFAQAEKYYQDALERTLKQKDPDREDLCRMHEWLAWLEHKQDKFKQSESNYREVIALREKMGSPKDDLATLHINLGSVFFDEGNRPEASAEFARAHSLTKNAALLKNLKSWEAD